VFPHNPKAWSRTTAAAMRAHESGNDLYAKAHCGPLHGGILAGFDRFACAPTRSTGDSGSVTFSASISSSAMAGISCKPSQCCAHLAWGGAGCRGGSRRVSFRISARRARQNLQRSADVADFPKLFIGASMWHRANVAPWHILDLPRCPLTGRYQGISGRNAGMAKTT
jgi:hypothetical protein